MKKKILFIFLFIILLFKCDDVYAAEEFTCLYKGGYYSNATMLVQNANGDISVYYSANSNTSNPEIDEKYWSNPAEQANATVTFNWDSNFYDENTKTLTGCPSFTRHEYNSGNDWREYRYYFYENKTWNHLDYGFYKKYLRLPDIKNFYNGFDKNKDYSEQIINTKWIGICNYDEVVLYFNNDTYILDNKRKDLIERVGAKFSLYELLDFYEQTNSCPARLYKVVNAYSGAIFSSTYHLNKVSNSIEIKFVKEGSVVIPNENINKDDEKVELDDCSNLFSQGFIDEINSYLVLVRILVPILLVILGILDFAKAIFSSNEDGMKKAQQKFIKRLIAAIIVFLIPLLVDLLLEIANSIWAYIDPNSCNIG